MFNPLTPSVHKECILSIFDTFSSVSVNNFEQVNVSWLQTWCHMRIQDPTKHLYYSFYANIATQEKLHHSSEAAFQRCPSEKMFWKYTVNLQENTHTKV